jgi:hypothetical protein
LKILMGRYHSEEFGVVVGNPDGKILLGRL